MEAKDAYIEELLSQLTLDEKIGMIHGNAMFRTKGVERLGIPPLKMSDGPMGVRQKMTDEARKDICMTDDLVTYLPSSSAFAATWNRELAGRMGKVLGEEARGRGKDMILAPGINIKRDPRCGRSFEYMSEDPYLTAELAVPLIRGIQKSDVSACVKHFVANNQETGRLDVDEQIEERALREIYLPAFRAAVQRGGSYALMSAYNRLNGTHCSENVPLLEGILRREWGFDGVIVSDWGAVHRTKEAAMGPLDIEMDVTTDFDNYKLAKPLAQAIHAGEVDEACVDEKIRNILRLMICLKMIGSTTSTRCSGTFNTPEHRAAAFSVARESVVLLKNEDGRLPLCREKLKKLLVVGKNAEIVHANGGGSAAIKALYEISPLLGISMKLGGNTEVRYVPGYFIPEQQPENTAVSPAEQRRQAEQEQRLREEAAALATAYDEVIFIGGLDHRLDVEGKDRTDITLPYGQDALIEALLDANPRTVLAFVAGSPVNMRHFAGRAKAIVWSWYSGCEGGTALAEVLLGEVNPSGKLPETFPASLDDCPAERLGEFGDPKRVVYRDGVFVGYRYYDSFGIAPAFPFGHGLSYTTFSYENVQVDSEETADGGVTATVHVEVKNTGTRMGAEVVQVYVSPSVRGKQRPLQELRGFKKLFLKPGEKKTVVVTLPTEAFAFYRKEEKAFIVEPGTYRVRVGGSSRAIRAEQDICIAKKNACRL